VLQLTSEVIVPFRKVHEVVALRALGETSDSEPTGLAVVAGSAVAGDSITEDLAAGAGGVNLGGVGEITDDGDLGQRPRGGGAEGAGSRGRGDGGAAEDGRERHACLLVWYVVGEELKLETVAARVWVMLIRRALED
jgi:hypothetical protein